MGILIESRKRCLIDLRAPSSPHSILDLTTSPPSKKPKIQSEISLPNPRPASYLPPSPLSRQILGPQRISRAFKSPKMGNFVSRVFERLGLEEYRELVREFRYEKASVGSGLGFGFAEEVSQPLDSNEVRVLNRRVEDAKRVVEESVEVREEKVWVKRRPAWEGLYEESKRSDRRLSSLEFELKLAEEQLSALRFVPKVHDKKLKEAQELFSPLTDEEEGEVSHALRGGQRSELLVAHETSNIEITRGILLCLSSSGWLNDEVINLYLELLKERERRDPNKFLKCHFFNTFFYKKLISGRNGYDFKAVKRWSTQKKLGYGLIDCDKIFVPIHQNIHWCLAVINVKDETFQYLDSLGGSDPAVLGVLAQYLMDEVKDKSNRHIDTKSWKQETVDDLPDQQNGWDCGMFMLKYIDFYSRGLSLCFGQEHMAYFRRRTVKEILRLKAD